MAAPRGARKAEPLDEHGLDEYKAMLDKTTIMWKKGVSFKPLAKSTVKATSKLLDAAEDSQPYSVNWIDSLRALATETTDDTYVALEAFISILGDIQELQGDMCTEMMESFCKPLNNFADYKYGRVHFAKGLLRKAVRELYGLQEHYEKACGMKDGKVESISKVEQLEQELEKMRDVVAERNKKFAATIQSLNKAKEVDVLRAVLNMIHSQERYYAKVHALFEAAPFDQIEEDLRAREAELRLGPRLEGYLLVKRNNTWNREFFELSNGQLYNFKTEKFSPARTIDLQLCAVKELESNEKQKIDIKKGFQLVSPGQKKPLTLLAESESEKAEWVDKLMEAISLSLDQAEDLKSRAEEDENEKVVKILRAVPGNLYCADCNASSPTWASINLGILVCLECSGVHRSLGSHISKVRSMTLDHWDMELIAYMCQLGNERCNHLYENKAPPDEKPTPESDRSAREEWITAKYLGKAFIPGLTAGFHLNKMFFEQISVPRCDLMKTVVLLFVGADPNFVINGIPAVVAAAKADNWLFMQALSVWGCDFSAADDMGWTATHHAAYMDHFRPMILMDRFDSRGTEIARGDLLGDTPLELALRMNSVNVLKVLGGSLQSYNQTVLNECVSLSEQGRLDIDAFQAIFDNILEEIPANRDAYVDLVASANSSPTKASEAPIAESPTIQRLSRGPMSDLTDTDTKSRGRSMSSTVKKTKAKEVSGDAKKNRQSFKFFDKSKDKEREKEKEKDKEIQKERQRERDRLKESKKEKEKEPARDKDTARADASIVKRVKNLGAKKKKRPDKDSAPADAGLRSSKPIEPIRVKPMPEDWLELDPDIVGEIVSSGSDWREEDDFEYEEGLSGDEASLLRPATQPLSVSFPGDDSKEKEATKIKAAPTPRGKEKARKRVGDSSSLRTSKNQETTDDPLPPDDSQQDCEEAELPNAGREYGRFLALLSPRSKQTGTVSSSGSGKLVKSRNDKARTSSPTATTPPTSGEAKSRLAGSEPSSNLKNEVETRSLGRDSEQLQRKAVKTLDEPTGVDHQPDLCVKEKAVVRSASDSITDTHESIARSEALTDTEIETDEEAQPTRDDSRDDYDAENIEEGLDEVMKEIENVLDSVDL